MVQSTSRFVVSGFADEISPSLDEQLSVLTALDISHIDLRGVDGSGAVNLDDDEIAHTRKRLENADISVSSIGSPIGKVSITDPFEPHFERFERVLEVANSFDADSVRVFSYYIPEGEAPADYRDEVVSRMRQKAKLAEEMGVKICHENERGIYGDTPERCRDILTAVDSPNLRAVFDPSNFLEIGVHAYPDALLQLIEFVDHIHVKDCAYDGDEIVPAGEGDARFPEMIEILDKRGFNGYTSLEPHLNVPEMEGNLTGADGFERTVLALRNIFEECGVVHD